jgi:hypothetical protein
MGMTRSCVGRNLAYMNVTLIAAALFHRYSVEALPSTKVGGFYVVMKPAESDSSCKQLVVHETFLRETAHCELAIKRRHVG